MERITFFVFLEGIQFIIIPVIAANTYLVFVLFLTLVCTNFNLIATLLSLLLGRKVMTNLDSMLKSRDITWPAKVRLVKAMVFPGVMYGCESWTVRKAECQKFYAFELWCWIRFLRVPGTARISNQSILNKISPGCSLDGLMLKPKLQYFGHLMRRVN